MRFAPPIVAWASLSLLLAARCAVAADARVELEIVTERGAPLNAQQEWVKALAEAGVQNVRIRGAQSGDLVGIVNRGSARAPSYKVTGALTARGTVRLPGGTFSLDQSRRLAAWLAEIAKHGPGGKEAQEQIPFGLSKEQFATVTRELSTVVSFSTKDAAVRDLVAKLEGLLTHPLASDAEARKALAGDARFRDELQGLSLGTALAATLRSAGLVFGPRGASGRLSYVVHRGDAGREAWPVGWPSESAPGRLVPGLAKIITIEIDERPLSQALEAVGGNLKTSILYDHAALARADVDPTKIQVQVERRREVLGSALRRMLYPHVKYEVRLDENQQPFLWIVPYQAR